MARGSGAVGDLETEHRSERDDARLRDDDQIALAIPRAIAAGETDAAVLFCAAALIAEELGSLTARPSEEAEASASPG